MRDIAKNIRSLRIAKKMTQDELAEKLFVTRQTVSNYETGKTRPDVEMLARIAEVLETDVNTLIYGSMLPIAHRELKRLIIGAILTVITGLLVAILIPLEAEYRRRAFVVGYDLPLKLWLLPLACLFAGWTLAQLVGMALKKKPLNGIRCRQICLVLLAVILIWMILSAWFSGAIALNSWLFYNYLRGEWVEVEGINVASYAWSKLPPPIPAWLDRYAGSILLPLHQEWPFLMAAFGALVWLLGFPRHKDT